MKPFEGFGVINKDGLRIAQRLKPTAEDPPLSVFMGSSDKFRFGAERG